jgi:drug/metabolite transporter (DMT)-like permease
MTANQRRPFPPPEMHAHLVLISAMLLWGLNVPLMKLLLAYIHPITLAWLRMSCACLVFGAIAFWRNGCLPSIPRTHWKALFICGGLMVYVNQILFNPGMARTTATNTALILGLGPLISSLLATIAFREKLGVHRMAGIAIALGGVAMVILQRPGAELGAAGLGDALVAASVLSFAIGGVLVQRLARQLDALSISLVIHVTGAVLLAMHASFTGFDQRTLDADGPLLMLIVLSGVGATAIGNLIWNRSIGTLGFSRAALYLNLVPLFAITAAVIFLGEPASRWLVLGFLCVVAGSWLGTGDRRQMQTAVAPLPR